MGPLKSRVETPTTHGRRLFSKHKRLDSYDKNSGFSSPGTTESVESDFVVSSGTPLGLHLSDGNLVTKIDLGSPCARKLKVGDHIVSVNGQEIEAGLQASELIGSVAFGDHLSIIATRPISGKGRGFSF